MEEMHLGHMPGHAYHVSGAWLVLCPCSFPLNVRGRKVPGNIKLLTLTSEIWQLQSHCRTELHGCAKDVQISNKVRLKQLSLHVGVRQLSSTVEGMAIFIWTLFSLHLAFQRFCLIGGIPPKILSVEFKWYLLLLLGWEEH